MYSKNYQKGCSIGINSDTPKLNIHDPVLRITIITLVPKF